MADQDSSFKITDRRKFNPDGTSREADEQGAAQAALETETKDEVRRENAGNVVSFPGEARKQTESELSSPDADASPPRRSSPTEPSPGQAERDYNQARGPQSAQMPEASFLGLVHMLGVEAAMHMGLVHNPGEEGPPADLESARHIIDILGILQAKTRGNLTAEEDNLFDGMLADLRMQFVAVSRRR